MKELRKRLLRLLKSPYTWVVLTRGLVFLLVPYAMRGDAGDYFYLAENLANGNGFSRCPWEPHPPTAERPPLFPFLNSALFLSGLPFPFSAFVLNLGLDLISVRLAIALGSVLQFRTAWALPWIVVICPFLLTYSQYPSHENISVTLALAAAYLLFTSRYAWSGLLFGVLTLARSYFLLFPLALLLVRPSPRMPRKAIAILVGTSFIVPTLWGIRNHFTLGTFAFSQTSGAGTQIHIGLTRLRFDWWDRSDVKWINSHPVLVRTQFAQCKPDSELAAVNGEINQMTRDFIRENPGQTLKHVAAKTWVLFNGWGQLFPYLRMPKPVMRIIEVLMLVFWFLIIRALIHGPRLTGDPPRDRRGQNLQAFGRLAVLSTLYVFGVTLPFAVDARYLLVPVILIVMAALESAGSPGALLRPERGRSRE